MPKSSAKKETTNLFDPPTARSTTGSTTGFEGSIMDRVREGIGIHGGKGLRGFAR
jgi:hypothetical protein